MKNSSVRLSIVIITWNEAGNLRRCLDSLVGKLDHSRDEIIVVDNGSSDGTADLVQSYSEPIRYLFLEKNYGVGPARNRGLFLARGEFCMTLDNDTIFLTQNPGEIVSSFFGMYPDAGVVGFKLLNVDGTRQNSTRRYPRFFQPIAARMPGARRIPCFSNEQRRHLMEDFDFDSMSPPLVVDYVLGANQVFRKEIAAILMGYDDRIFFGPEDAEFCVRLNMIGFKNYYSESIEIIHDYKRRTRKFSMLTVKHLLGFAYMLYKHKGVFKYSGAH